MRQHSNHGISVLCSLQRMEANVCIFLPSCVVATCVAYTNAVENLKLGRMGARIACVEVDGRQSRETENLA